MSGVKPTLQELKEEVFYVRQAVSSAREYHLEKRLDLALDNIDKLAELFNYLIDNLKAKEEKDA